MYYLLSFIPYFLFCILKTKDSLHMLQQNFYNETNRYLRWIKKNPVKSIITFDLIGLILIPITFLFNTKITYIAFALIYSILAIIKLVNKKTEQVKKPLKLTFRIKRLFITTLMLYFIGIYFTSSNINALFITIPIMATLTYIMVYLAYLINQPIEIYNFNYYKNKAKKRLEYMNIPVIGITGSYGKTSSKNILHDILSIKYRVFASKGNYNTPLGLMLTVNSHLDKFDEIFIPEISAAKIGDITKVSSFLKPKYGIITNIGLAHLDTFKTEENIQTAKFELIECLPTDGVGVLNLDDPKQANYKLKNNCKIIWISINNKKADIYATNIKCTYQGTSFDATFKNDKNKLVHFETKLYGNPNIYNILASLAISQEFDLTYDEMVKGVKSIKPIEHRLELKKYKNITIIDDAYNSNPVGSSLAVDTLNLMPGQKIIVTPGMIELKDKQYELNKELGIHIAKVCDYVILVGKEQTKPIYDGLIASKYKKENIMIINDVKDAFKIIDDHNDGNTFVLLENDLPDLFNEKKS